MTPSTGPAQSGTDALFLRLRDLERHLASAGVNKHDRVHMLINACIGEGIDTGCRIVGVLAALGFNRQHAGITLKAGLKCEPEWPNWGRSGDGRYYAPPEPPVDA
ncbi:hypothetical protein [Altererythrobacter sp. TH136]|uniref:hypothetical protein n=1 Tax=Altererythrobacter sp. TH136 TaxID=2067415 RepID=UPI0011629376|nr:hypothetical protein [Altererythrobacter sp. TH136]QDM40630.1 hypothetical protein C0V74_05920 [Altererythrobacter sp. TH136]